MPESIYWAENGQAKIHIDFSDGTGDMITLSPYNPIPLIDGLETEAQIYTCNYLGTMMNLQDAQVAVHGCPGDNKFEVTVFSDQFDKNKFVINNGEIEVLESPFVEGSTSEMVDEVKTIEGGDQYSKRRRKRQATTLPSTMTMNLILGYDSSYLNQHGSDSNVLNELRNVMTVSQAHFFHSSLTTRITLNVVNVRAFPSKIYINYYYYFKNN